jgi:hypothetical protein
MKLFPMLLLGGWLAVGTGFPANAQPTLPPGSPEHPCDQPAAAAAAGIPDGHAVVATVTRVDMRQGTVEVLTPEGSFELTLPPAALDGLRLGDHMVLCLEGDALDGEDRLAYTLREKVLLPFLPPMKQRRLHV